MELLKQALKDQNCQEIYDIVKCETVEIINPSSVFILAIQQKHVELAKLLMFYTKEVYASISLLMHAECEEEICFLIDNKVFHTDLEKRQDQNYLHMINSVKSEKMADLLISKLSKRICNQKGILNPTFKTAKKSYLVRTQMNKLFGAN